MQDVTAIIVLFIFACIAYPQLVKNRPQFYAAIGLALLIIFFDCIGHIFLSLAGFAYFINAIFQIGAIATLVLSTGGKSLSELSGEIGESIDVVRRGGEKQSFVVPLKGEQPKPRNDPPPYAPPKPAKPADRSSIPLD